MGTYICFMKERQRMISRKIVFERIDFPYCRYLMFVDPDSGKPACLRLHYPNWMTSGRSEGCVKLMDDWSYV